MITRLKKFFGFHVHEWTKWGIIESGKTGISRDRVFGTYIVQTRRCITCGKQQISRSST